MSVFYSYIWVNSNDTFSEWHHHQAVSNPQEQLRMLKVLVVFLQHVLRQGGEIFLTQTADEEGAAEDVVDVAIIIPLGLGYNRALRDDDGNIYDILCGPFFVCGLGEEEFTSLPEELLHKYNQLFQHPELFLRVGDSLMVLPF